MLKNANWVYAKKIHIDPGKKKTGIFVQHALPREIPPFPPPLGLKNKYGLEEFCSSPDPFPFNGVFIGVSIGPLAAVGPLLESNQKNQTGPQQKHV